MLKPSKLLNPLTTIRKIKKEEGISPLFKMDDEYIYKEEDKSFYFIMNLSLLYASLLFSK